MLTAVYAVGAALTAIAFQLAVGAIYGTGLMRLAHESTAWFVAGSFLVTVGGALLAGWLLERFCREAAGSGIPQLQRSFWNDFGFASWRLIWVKFVAAAVQIGGGSSLGREGPSVQLAGSVSSQIAGIFGEAKQRHRRASATGAAAGLAAAFNTPLAAVTFVLEEIIGDLNSRLLGGVLLAAMIGALVTHSILGPQPAFALAPVGEPSWQAHLLVPVVAACAALAGAAFQAGALGLRGRAKAWQKIPRVIRPALGALVCWALGCAVFFRTQRLGVFGLGYEDLSDALAGRLPWTVAALLLGAKFIGTVACYGMGGCGGIFSPTLFFGAMVGLNIGGIAQTAVTLSPDSLALLAIVGMSASLGAVVRAPVTSILIVFEMTHEFALVLPLMLAALVSQALSRRLMRENFYDALLAQDGQSIEHITLPRDLQAWQDQPVSRFATKRPIAVESLTPAALRDVLDNSSHARFPVLQNGCVAGMLLRNEALAALAEERAPQLVEALICRPSDRVREAAALLVESSVGMLVVQGENGDALAAVFTLHDLLRAQMAAADHHASLEG